MFSSTDKISRSSDSAAASHVSLFPFPPWQLVNKYQPPTTNTSEQPPRPPTPPGLSVYRMFGTFYNLDDSILRSLESQGVRRIYPHTYYRKRELRKINFSILANYLDLLDVLTRDPSSAKRTERLDNLAVLFINMHHLVNEYRQHQARDLLREVLRYQVNIASQTVDKAEQYMSRADEILKAAGNDLILPLQSSSSNNTTSCIDDVRNGLGDLGPELAPLLRTVLDETMGTTLFASSTCKAATIPGVNVSISTQPGEVDARMSSQPNEDTLIENLDSVLWQFLMEPKFDETVDVASPPTHLR